MMISPDSIKVLDTIQFNDESNIDEEEDANPDEPYVEKKFDFTVVCMRDTQMFINNVSMAPHSEEST